MIHNPNTYISSTHTHTNKLSYPIETIKENTYGSTWGQMLYTKWRCLCWWMTQPSSITNTATLGQTYKLGLPLETQHIMHKMVLPLRTKWPNTTCTKWRCLWGRATQHTSGQNQTTLTSKTTTHYKYSMASARPKYSWPFSRPWKLSLLTVYKTKQITNSYLYLLRNTWKINIHKKSEILKNLR